MRVARFFPARGKGPFTLWVYSIFRLAKANLKTGQGGVGELVPPQKYIFAPLVVS